jgi:hypothetical protein
LLCGGLASYFQSQDVMRENANHRKWERLANSDAVQHERRVFQKDPPPPAGFYPDPSTINGDGVRTVLWNKGYEVASLVTEDGETLYPTPAPSVLEYLLVVILPIFGFLIPWGGSTRCRMGCGRLFSAAFIRRRRKLNGWESGDNRATPAWPVSFAVCHCPLHNSFSSQT